ncbi:MAG: DNA polymerase IV [Clostridium sp.]|uniref:Y-family DNA polymerase n=1 Tax=Clostridium sp. TaxID=1506 RepID=UPI003D6D806F
MTFDMKRRIMHLDVNSAYLSFEAVYRLQHGEILDIREIPSAVGGDPESRHGIILAKSIPCNQYGVQTGETLYEARLKCAGYGVELLIFPPRYECYMKCSNALVELLREYTPKVQRYSIDECFLDFTGMENMYPNIEELAFSIKERIKKELGFAVSVGVSINKLLAKMGSDMAKDAVVTLYPQEIKKKMWPLPVGDLFMVGRQTNAKLFTLGIETISDLANYDPEILKFKLKSHGQLIWNYAHGIENSEVRKSNHMVMKGIGNSTTVSFDVEDAMNAHLVLLSLTESVAVRLRYSQNTCRLVEVSYVSKDFIGYSRQKKLSFSTDSTTQIAKIANMIFDELWKGDPVRKLGVRVSELCSNEFTQATLFDDKDIEKQRKIDVVVDDLRVRFGSKSITKASFIHSGIHGLSMGMGGGEEDYPLMSSIL